MRRRPGILVPLVPALLALVSACGITDSGPAQAGPPATGGPERESRPADVVHVYLSSPLGLERVSRLSRGPNSPQDALNRLREGPDEAERARGLISFVPRDAPAPTVTGQRRGGADVLVPRGWGTHRTALRQLVCTAADAVGTADGTPLGEVEVRVRRAPGGATDTQRCELPPGSGRGPVTPESNKDAETT
ncbi:hypothetical protein ACFVZM_22270 [Streptomyces sioyaensis]|uniref:hypothetical protein n=1 Tax=Streptomyces sioyaensis TaxID=67364 RepID=UPI0036A069FF